MMLFEYKVVPAPERGKKARGARSAPDRFASTLEALMNELAQDGWEYHRAETLPSEERAGLTGRTTVYRNLLIFRRPDQNGAQSAQPPVMDVEGAESISAEAPRPTEAQRARSAGLRAILPAALKPKAGVEAPEAADADAAMPVPPSSDDTPSAEAAAAAAAAAALRSVKPPEKKKGGSGPLTGEKPGLVSLMADKRASRPSK